MQPQPIHLSSGNLTADRRYEWARDFAARGDFTGAADLYSQAVDLAPDYAAAWFALGEVRDRLGDRDGAVAAFTRAAALDPDDRHGATMHLVRLGVLPASAMPEAYVRTLFDGYAPAFDKALTEGLGYRAPDLLLRAVEARLPFGAVLDLGCGTGLAGTAFRLHCGRLTGVDLSPAMLVKARGKGIYDRLEEGDVLRFLAGEAAAHACYDLVLAADVFVYLDDLAPVLAAASRVLASGGLTAFSVETHDGESVILRDTLRYAHGEAHVRAALAAAGLTVVSLDSASTRTEKGIAVPGLVVVATGELPPPLRGRVGEGGLEIR